MRTPVLERLLPAVFCFAATPALAIELEADLSTHQVDIRTNFQGAEIMVFGAVTGRPETSQDPTDLIVVIRGAPEAVEVRRKSRLGPVWANADNFTARGVPSFYAIASTRPLDEIADTASLERYKIGFDHLPIAFDVRPPPAARLPANPPAGPSPSAAPSAPIAAEPLSVATTAAETDVAAFRQALIRLLKDRQTFRTDDDQLTFVRSDLFRVSIAIPPTAPPGNYGAEVYLLQHKSIVSAEYMSFYIDKKGLEADISNLAHKDPLPHGLLAVAIAALFGWASELLFRRR